MRTALALSLVMFLWVAGTSSSEIPLPEFAVARFGQPLAKSIAASSTIDIVAIANPLGVELRDPSTLEIVGRVPETYGSQCVAFDSSGIHLAIVSGESFYLTLRIWDCATDVVDVVLELDLLNPKAVWFSPHGRFLAVRNDISVAIWDTTLWTCLASLPLSEGEVVFSPDGEALVVGLPDGSVKYHSISALQDAHPLSPPEQVMKVDGEIASLCFSPDGSVLAVGTYDSGVELWNTQNWQRLRILQSTGQYVEMMGYMGRYVTFSPDGLLVCATRTLEGSSIHLWEPNSGNLRQELVAPNSLSITGLAMSAGGRNLLAATLQGAVLSFPENAATPSYDTARTVKLFTSRVSSLAFSPESDILAVGSWDCTRIWDLGIWPMTSVTLDWRPHSRPRAVGLSSDGDLLMSEVGGDTRIYDLSTNRRLNSYNISFLNIDDIEVSSVQEILAVASDEHSIAILDFETGQVLQTIDPGTPVCCLSLSSDGKSLAAGLEDGTIQVWDIDAVNILLQQEISEYCANDVRFSPGGEYLVIGARELLIYDTKTWQIVGRRWTSQISRPLAFSPDGSILGMHNILFRFPELTPIVTLEGRYEDSVTFVTSVAFDSTGRYYATGSSDGTVLLYDLQAATAGLDANQSF